MAPPRPVRQRKPQKSSVWTVFEVIDLNTFNKHLVRKTLKRYQEVHAGKNRPIEELLPNYFKNKQQQKTDLGTSSTNDATLSLEPVSTVSRMETPMPSEEAYRSPSLECTKAEDLERPVVMTTSDCDGGAPTDWPTTTEGNADARHKLDDEMPSTSDSRN